MVTPTWRRYGYGLTMRCGEMLTKRAPLKVVEKGIYLGDESYYPVIRREF